METRGDAAPNRPPPPNPNLPYREDCWSEGETAALVDAWGSRYLELNRGNLRQKQWQEVADAVNSRRGAAARRRPPRTDVQCKNRVDTLKKKYKSERARMAAAAGPTSSSWPFYSHLDELVGPTVAAAAAAMMRRPSPSRSSAHTAPLNSSSSYGYPYPQPHPPPFSAAAVKKPSPPSLSPSPPPLALPLPNYRKGSPLPTASFIQNAVAAAAAAAKDDYYEDDDEDDEEEEEETKPPVSQLRARSVHSLQLPLPPPKRAREMKQGGGGGGEGEASGFRELARAIEYMAEMYERVESAKLRQAMEIERQKLEHLKGTEMQRMQSFVEAQVRLEKSKRAKKEVGVAELLATVAAMPFLSTPAYF